MGEVIHLSGRSELMTTTEAAELLRTTQRTIYRWIDAGVLPAAKIGGRWRIRRRDVEALFQSKQGGKEHDGSHV